MSGRFTWRTHGDASIHVDVRPELVYEHVVDVTRTGDRSLECRSAEWLPGSEPGTVGARFRGRNRSGLARWSRVCEVIDARPGEAFAFRTVPERLDLRRADSTVWRYTLTPEGDGTRVVHDYEIVRLPVAGYRHLLSLLLPHHKDMRPHLAHTLQALKDEVESRTVA